MQITSIILQAVAGLLIGAGAGAVVGFISWGLVEKLNPSGGVVILAPSGALNVGLFGALLMGLAGVVVGFITGALGLRAYQGAALGVLIFTLMKWRAIYSDLGSVAGAIRHYFAGGHLDRQLIFMNIITNVTLIFDFALVGAIVAVSLRHLFAGGRQFPP